MDVDAEVRKFGKIFRDYTEKVEEELIEESEE